MICKRLIAVSFFVLCVSGGGYCQGEGRGHVLIAGGDTMIARWVHYPFYEHGPGWMLGDIKELLSTADICMVNLECVVSSKGDFFDKGEARPYLYRARPEMLTILTEAGVDLVTTANNHSMDYGGDALIDQMQLLKQCGIHYVGSGSNIEEAQRPVYMKAGDVVVAFIAIETYSKNCAVSGDRAGIFYIKDGRSIPQAIKEIVKEAKKHADLVVLSPHWGANWTEKPDSERIAAAHKIIDMGVDAILGHSAHQIHGVEIYRGRAIVYDMGSLLFDTVKEKRLRYSACFRMEFDESGFGKLSVVPVMLHSSRTVKAAGRESEYIKNLVVKLSRELDGKAKWERDGNCVSVRLSPEKDWFEGNRKRQSIDSADVRSGAVGQVIDFRNQMLW